MRIPCKEIAGVVGGLVQLEEPQIVRSGRTNVEPKGCGPNMLLRTRVEANLDSIVHQSGDQKEDVSISKRPKVDLCRPR